MNKAYAQFTVTPPTMGFTGTFGALVSQLVTLALIFGSLAALAMILFGGFKYLTAGDDVANAEGGRRAITNGVVGLIILASAFLLWQLIVQLLNLDSVLGAP